MGNFTLSEIMVILVVILIVFGPDRLPELARKAGSLARKAREAANTVRSELTDEYGDTIQPLQDVAQELKSARQDLRDTATSIIRDVNPEGPALIPPGEETADPAANGAGGREATDDADRTDADEATDESAP